MKQEIKHMEAMIATSTPLASSSSSSSKMSPSVNGEQPTSSVSVSILWWLTFCASWLTTTTRGDCFQVHPGRSGNDSIAIHLLQQMALRFGRRGESFVSLNHHLKKPKLGDFLCNCPVFLCCSQIMEWQSPLKI